LEKTFNRGFTDYFLQERKPMATLNTQKSLGKKLGPVIKIDGNNITLRSPEPLTAGDGLCFFNPKGELEGFLVNRVDGNTFQPNRMPGGLAVGTLLWRNHDQAFEKQLQRRTSSRKVAVTATLADTPNGLQLQLLDSDGCQAAASIECTKETAQNPQLAQEQTDKQLRKMGDTIFQTSEIHYRLGGAYFLPSALLGDLRRKAVAALEEARLAWHLARRGHSAPLAERQANTTPYFETAVDYRANILNQQAEQFYRRHGVQQMEYGLEKTLDYSNKALMTTKYCLRYELGCCLQGKDGKPGKLPIANNDQLYLHNNKHWFGLHFDCRNCQMLITAEKIPLKTK
jgi:putative protease